MVELVARLKDGQPVVHGVRRGEPPALKADAAEEGVGLDDVFDGLGANVAFDGEFRAQAVLDQRVVAKLRKRDRGVRRLAAGAGAGVGGLYRAGLEIGRQRVAHAADEQAGGRRRNDVGVDQHEIRIRGQEEVLLKDALVAVDDGERAAGGVGRGDRRHDDDGLLRVVGDGLYGVEYLAAADADDDVAVAHLPDEAVYLLFAALAAKFFKERWRRAETLCDGFFYTFHAGGAYQNKRLRAEFFHIAAEL